MQLKITSQVLQLQMFQNTFFELKPGNDNTIRFTYFWKEVQISSRGYIFFKQAQKVTFSCKTGKVHYPPAIFNDIPIVCSSC